MPPKAPSRPSTTAAAPVRKPPVPRARRPPPRSHSAGSLQREMWSRQSPHCGSWAEGAAQEPPISHGRVSSLSREQEAPENQTFKFGPPRREPSAKHRISSLNREASAHSGMPWAIPTTEVVQTDRSAARRNMLEREQQAGSSCAHEIAPEVSSRRAGRDRSGSQGSKTHARVESLSREWSPQVDMVAMALGQRGSIVRDGSAGAARSASHGRRNLLMREGTRTGSVEAPVPTAYDGNGLPSYGRRRMPGLMHDIAAADYATSQVAAY